MFKTIQIIKYLLKQGMNMSQIFAEFTEIVDNGRSDHFELTDRDIASISEIYHNDARFDAAYKAAALL